MNCSWDEVEQEELPSSLAAVIPAVQLQSRNVGSILLATVSLKADYSEALLCSAVVSLCVRQQVSCPDNK